MRPTRALIDLDALHHNLDLLQKKAPQSPLMGVVKADAYGHGVHLIAPEIAPHVACFAVAIAEEAVQLQKLRIFKPVLVLEGPQGKAGDVSFLRPDAVEWVIHTEEQLELLSPQKASSVWLKCNVGMNRLGFPQAELPVQMEALERKPHLHLKGIMSHYACADAPESGCFQEEREQAWQIDVPAGIERSHANSAALLSGSVSPGEWVRPGIALYGGSPYAGQSGTDLGLRPVMTLISELIAVRHLKPGDCVGYGASWRAETDTLMGIVPIGYADGYDRHLSNCGFASLEGVRVPVIGRVSMDMVALDLSAVPRASPGTPVELWGRQLSVDALSAAAGTISYELLSGLSARVPRQAL